jgi:hypothetical protein
MEIDYDNDDIDLLLCECSKNKIDMILCPYIQIEDIIPVNETNDSESIIRHDRSDSLSDKVIDALSIPTRRVSSSMNRNFKPILIEEAVTHSEFGNIGVQFYENNICPYMLIIYAPLLGNLLSIHRYDDKGDSKYK